MLQGGGPGGMNQRAGRAGAGGGKSGSSNPASLGGPPAQRAGTQRPTPRSGGGAGPGGVGGALDTHQQRWRGAPPPPPPPAQPPARLGGVGAPPPLPPPPGAMHEWWGGPNPATAGRGGRQHRARHAADGAPPTNLLPRTSGVQHVRLRPSSRPPPPSPSESLYARAGIARAPPPQAAQVSRRRAPPASAPWPGSRLGSCLPGTPAGWGNWVTPGAGAGASTTLAQQADHP